MRCVHAGGQDAFAWGGDSALVPDKHQVHSTWLPNGAEVMSRYLKAAAELGAWGRVLREVQLAFSTGISAGFAGVRFVHGSR